MNPQLDKNRLMCLAFLIGLQLNYGCKKLETSEKFNPSHSPTVNSKFEPKYWIHKEYIEEPSELDTSVSFFSSYLTDVFRIHIINQKDEQSCSDCDKFIFVSKQLDNKRWLITDVRRVQIKPNQMLRPNCYLMQDTSQRALPALVQEKDSEENLQIDSAWLPDMKDGKLHAITTSQVTCNSIDEESVLYDLQPEDTQND
jgi:hypothetical protein